MQTSIQKVNVSNLGPVQALLGLPSNETPVNTDCFMN